MKTLIIANGEILNYTIIKKAASNHQYVIACDGGLNHAEKLNIAPNCILGDMDSASPVMLEQYKNMGVEVVTYPTKKDETDLELAIFHALKCGATSIRIIGALGGRFDHALANLHLLALAPQKIEIYSEDTSIHIIESTKTLEREDYKTLSLIPLTTEVTGIVTHGLVYPLNGETLKIGASRGISNEFKLNTAKVSVNSGLLLAIRCK